MIAHRPVSVEEVEFKAAIEGILRSPSSKKLVIAGPGTGKTSLFMQMLTYIRGESNHRMVLTFINTLKEDLAADLAGLA